MAFWKSWRFKNLTLLGLSILLAFFLSKLEIFHRLLLNLGTLGYFGAFVGGMLFVSTFTVATGAVILLVLAESLQPIEIGLIAGLGAVLGDLAIFKFVKNKLTKELVYIYNHINGHKHFTRVLHSKYFSWTLPVIGALIIASPLPDELGVSLLGISKMKSLQFLLISFALNAVGIFLVVSAALVIKP